MIINEGVNMWTRKDLKVKAKEFLKNHYWKAFVVCLIVALLTGMGGNSSSNNGDNGDNDSFFSQKYYTVKINPSKDLLSSIDRGLKNPFTFRVTLETLVFLIVFGIIVSIIIGNALQVGEKRFFIESFKGEAKIGTLFTTFKNGEWLPITGKILLMDIYLFLWTLLFIIPGIIKSYQYRMVPYILSENSDLSTSNAIKISREMTNNEKWEIFVLDLSFIGWYLLGSLLFGLGGIFVLPYHEATITKLYENYREDIPVEEQFNYILD